MSGGEPVVFRRSQTAQMARNLTETNWRAQIACNLAETYLSVSPTLPPKLCLLKMGGTQRIGEHGLHAVLGT